MMNYDVAVVGEIYIDHIFTGFATWPQPGEEVFTRQYKREIGGGATNTACALARLGRTVSLVGVIGTSDAGWFEDRLREFGVSSDGLEETGGNTGVTVSVSMLDDRSFFSYVGENDRLVPRLWLEAVLASLRRARHVHFAMPLGRELAMHLLPALRASGCTTSLDVGFRPDWLRDVANLDTCRSIDYLLPNEREASLLCNSDSSNYLSFAQDIGFPQAVVKLGSRGAAMFANRRNYTVFSPSVHVMDTTGAGDAFDAGFIDALLDSASADDCLRRACICGALSTRSAGALTALPLRAELESIYEQTYTS
ncbi:MAG: carbohydrate kinase family protein [Edaphobacter sp.]|nr:carbohydrate kinase family protein [Edaphobacter sp.]